jgi:hypothetical protein
MRWLFLCLVSCVFFSAATFGTFLPLSDAAGVQYVYVWPGASTWILGSAAMGLALAALYAAVLWSARRRAPSCVDEARSGRWMSSLSALGVIALGVLPAAPGMGESTAFVAYFLFDLRWWWLGAAVIWMLVRIDGIVGQPIGRQLGAIARWSSQARLLLLDSVLIVVVMACALAFTRHLRFDPGLNGDEPKYIRYGEVWYQGGGFEVSGKKPVRDMPLDAESQVSHNFVRLARAIGEESRAMVTDVRGFLSDPGGFQWNRGQRIEGFVIGKRGGKYQIYLPGASFFLFPGYFLDRHVLGLRATSEGEFPADLVMTNLAMLLTYGFCAVALFRLLRHALGSDALAIAWAAVAMISLPAGAFAFQFYPEVPALLVVILSVTYVWFQAPNATWLTSAAGGIATAGLAWFHPRFLLLSAVLALTGVLNAGSRRSRAAFVMSAGFVYFTVMAFSYRVTGSWMPNALWDSPGSDPTLSLQGAPIGVLGYALHRTWGLAPHAPLLLAALPGLAVLARQSKALAVFLVAVLLALTVPAAAHTLNAAGSTPGRLIVAVAPLLIWPVAVAVRRFWSWTVVRTATIVALVLSLEAAVSYNWNHIKILGAMRSTGSSGWRPNLAFPVVAGGGWSDSTSNVVLLLIMLAALAATTIGAYVLATRASSGSVRAPGVRAGSPWAVAAGTFGLIVLLSGAATAFNRDWTSWEYLIADADARGAAAAALVDFDACRVCFATRARAIDWRWLETNGTQGIDIETSVTTRTARVRVFLNGGNGLRFGRIRTDFGDGSTTPWTGIVNGREIVHTYDGPGTYTVVVWLQLRTGEMRADRRAVLIAGS